jgi:hypothetical protein
MYYPQPPPPPPQYPPPRGSNVGLIVALILVPLVLLFFFGAGIAMFVIAAKKSAARSAAMAAATSTSTSTSTTYTPSATMTEAYTAKNGLIVAHYPADFAAKAVDNDTVNLQKNLSDGSADLVQVAAVINPISDDVDEFGRILIRSMSKDIESYGDKWFETGRSHTACYKTFSGLEVKGWFMASGVTKTNVKLCFFMSGKHGYMLKTIVPAAHETAEMPLLDSIVDATELR